MADEANTPKPAAPKATKLEAAQRVTMLVPLVLAGLRPAEIVRIAQNPTDAAESKGFGWQLSGRQIEKYVARAMKEIEKSAELDRDRMFRRAIARLEFLYGRAMRKGDLRIALQTQREIHALLGFVSSRPEFNQHIAVVAQAQASAASTGGPVISDSLVRKILDIKRRQTLAVERGGAPALNPGDEIKEQSA